MPDLNTTMAPTTEVPVSDLTGAAGESLSRGLGDSLNNGLVAGITLSNVLAVTAVALLVFVSAGVLYLSTVEWRDRRRRGKPAPAKR